MLPAPPLCRLRQNDTVRLIPSRFAYREDSVLTAIAENATHLRDPFELDNATNERLIGEQGGLAGIGVDELVFAASLDPVSYLASQCLATQLVNAGSMGIIYPSVRRESGTNLACFRPALVGNLRRGAAFRLSWSGSPRPVVKPLLTN